MREARWKLVAMALAGVILASPLAANVIPPPGHMLGPVNPPLADTPGNGSPNPAVDTAIGLNRTGNTVTITSPWGCNPASVKNQILLSNPDPSGRFRTASRFSENLNKTQQVTITQFDSQGEPIGFAYSEIQSGNTVRTGLGMLISSRNDGVYDTFEIQNAGGTVLATVSLTTFNTSDSSSPNYISMPWAQTAALGGKTACDGSNPQVFVPVATNGHIVLDLDGNGAPDPDVFASPLVVQAAIAAIPTLAPVGLIILAGLLLAASMRFLRRTAGSDGGAAAAGV